MPALISVSRSTVIDNTALYENIDNITHAYVDTLDSHLRESLLETGKVTYTKHTAFEHGFSYENNTKYFEDLNFHEISSVVNLSEGRICQLHAEALELLKDYIENQKIDILAA